MKDKADYLIDEVSRELLMMQTIVSNQQGLDLLHIQRNSWSIKTDRLRMSLFLL
jgi:hypothetical protein